MKKEILQSLLDTILEKSTIQNQNLNDIEKKIINKNYSRILFRSLEKLSKNSSGGIKEFIINQFEEYKEIQQDVKSSLENPNCECKDRFINFISNNIESCGQILTKTILENEIDETILEEVKDLYTLGLNRGEMTRNGNLKGFNNNAKIIEIQKSTASFQTILSQTLKSVAGNNISFQEDDEKIKIIYF